VTPTQSAVLSAVPLRRSAGDTFSLLIVGFAHQKQRSLGLKKFMTYRPEYGREV
jgi:hypothetical protein